MQKDKPPVVVCGGMSEKRSGRSENNRQGHGEAQDAFAQYGHRQPYGDLHSAKQGSRGFNLAQAAINELHEAGFKPEFTQQSQQQVAEIEQSFAHGVDARGAADLRALGWSSIDNDTSKDLDQIEVAERLPAGIRIRVGVGDVAATVEKGSPIDEYAKNQTQTVYTAVRNFPMLPLELSAGLTSLNENEDHLAIMMSFTVAANGELLDETVSRARVRNRAQLAYSRVGPWLDAGGIDTKNVVHLRSDSAREHDSDEAAAEKMSHQPGLPADWLAEQLKLQDEATQTLHRTRIAAGALDFHKAEAEPVLVDGHIANVHQVTQNRAMHLIEDLMVAANGVMARALRKGRTQWIAACGQDSPALGSHRCPGAAKGDHSAGTTELSGAEPLSAIAARERSGSLSRSGRGGDQADGSGRVYADASR